MTADDHENDQTPEPEQEETIDTNKEATSPKYPVFCQAIPPIEYWTELSQNTNGRGWQEIRRSLTNDATSSTSKAVRDRQDGLFVASSIEDIYDYYRTHIRPANDSSSFSPFTYFTFLVIDRECIISAPLQCIICCDAPDYEEQQEVTLKIMRVPLPIADTILVPLEQLTMTTSEALNPFSEVLGSFPPFTQIQDPDRAWGLFTHATPAQARRHKEQAIAFAEQREVPLEVGIGDRLFTDDGRHPMIFKTSWEEAERVACLQQQAEQSARELGVPMSHHSNHRDVDVVNSEDSIERY